MSNHHVRDCCPHETKETSSPSVSSPSSSPLPLASSSSSELPTPGPPPSSCSISSSSSPEAASSSTFLHDEKEPSLELVIQYGRGRCPYSFLHSSLLGTSRMQRNENSDADDDRGSIMLSIPIETTSVADIRGTRSTDDSSTTTIRSTSNNKSTAPRFRRMCVRWYRFQPSLSSEMERADLIVTHAGAGTLLEALDISSSTKFAAKPKIVNAVINNELMNNHQSELAEELERRAHILVTRDCTSAWTTKNDATRFWEEIEEFAPKPFAGGESSRNGSMEQQGTKEDDYVSSFQRIVDGVMGFYENWSTDNSTKKTR